MNTKKLCSIILIIALMPLLPFVISKGWETRLTPPEKSLDFSSESNSDYSQIKIRVLHKGDIINLPLFDYIYGVVAAEMPPTYEKEAIKAQAVAAASHTAYKALALKEDEQLYSLHNGAVVCTDPNHCKAYITKEELKEKWGTLFENYNEKIENCVREVFGLILTYNGKPANGVFHAVSAGFTESAKDIWGYEVPYLLSVESLQDEKSENFISGKEIPLNEFKKKLEAFSEQEISQISLGEITATAHGTVKNLTISGVEFKGSEIREIFNLKSSNFKIELLENKVVITTKGYGHGVGLSQFGANALAKEGKNYEEILKSYYTDIEIEPYNFMA